MGNLLATVVVTADAGFLATALAALRDVATGGLTVHADLSAPDADEETSPLYVEALAKARSYLAKGTQKLTVTVVQAPSLEGAADRLDAVGTGAAGPLCMVYVDAASTGLEANPHLDVRLEAFYDRLSAAGVAFVRSPYAVLVHRLTPPWSGGAHVLPDRALQRLLVPEWPWLLRTEQLCALVDFVERTFDKPRNHKAALRPIDFTVGDEVVRFLHDRVGPSFLFFYYTGSSVSPLIDHLERASSERGAVVLRGANEHALASGALANHLLHGRPSLTVVGTAMMDEMRGTLANLRSAGAQGFILCPEADEGSWFTFQGTITGDEDMRQALAARGLPCVYLDRPETLAERLEEAFRLYEEARGPVVLLITQSVLDLREPLAQRPEYPPRAADRPRVQLSSAQEDALDKALAILGQERTRVLWQASRTDPEEEALVDAIAERAGIALVDTLGHPGATHREGRRIPNYLGTLGLYGFNQRSYAFLHEGGKLAPKGSQILFFLKSKLGQRATNFTPFRRAGLRMVQLTRRADHVAPDVELALVMEAKDFLRRVYERLEVDPDVLRHREAAIRAALSSHPADEDLASRIPSVPMSPNYFFRELGALFEELVAEGYAYTAVLDVGRCSVSATRSVPRTTRGYSGWYGRALMGDAPAAIPTLAVTEPGHLVAFVGDGARSIIADPVPALLENALAHPARFDKNVTIFYFSNGTFSGIRTYRERLSSKWGGRQMRTFDLVEPDREQDLGSLHVVRRTLASFDADALREALLARRRLNVFTVLLGHNNDDDGFTLVSAGWQRETPSPT
jgi:thiamine pyrophosphate-dependent acetolactate synthase large subunit-like protein